jgi:hypothetical protein
MAEAYYDVPVGRVLLAHPNDLVWDPKRWIESTESLDDVLGHLGRVPHPVVPHMIPDFPELNFWDWIRSMDNGSKLALRQFLYVETGLRNNANIDFTARIFGESLAEQTVHDGLITRRFNAVDVSNDTPTFIRLS